MVVYYGVVRDNRIELEGGARLAEGQRVEVRPQGAARDDSAAVDADLRAAGWLEDLPATGAVAEGTRVEVHTGSDDTAPRAAEKALIRRLRAEGLIEEPPADDDDGEDDEEFEPVVVQGEPLSEQIIRERR